MNQFSTTNMPVQFDAKFSFGSHKMQIKAVEVNVVQSDLLCSTQVFVVEGKKDAKKVWIKHHELYEGETTLGPRVMTPVQILGQMPKHTYMMDAVTGSLYDKSGDCLTSDNMRLLSVAKADGLDQRLLAITFDRY